MNHSSLPMPSPSFLAHPLQQLWNLALRGRSVSSLLVALFLQFAPLVRTIEPAVTGLLQPVFILLRWATAATAIAGGAHALSGATGLTSPNTVRGTNGVPLAAYRAGITSDSHGAAKSYSATGLPPGVSIGRIGGAVSGTPTRAGVFAARVTGWENNNATGNSFTATVTFTIVDPAISISAQPQPATVTEGGPVTFSVAATGGTLTYRWLHDDLEIANATNATYSIAAAKLSDAGNYQVRIQNSGNTLFSAKALLTVNPGAQPPTFTALSPNVTAHEGESTILSATATATGTVPTLAWSFEGNLIPSATGNTLSLTQLTPAKAGAYRAIATANGLSTTSAPIAVVVTSALRIANTVTDANGLTVTLSTVNGRRYLLESASDPTATLWQTRAQATANGASLQLTDPDLTAETRFYRVRTE